MKKQTGIKLRRLIERLIREEQGIDLMATAKQWVRLVQSRNGIEKESELNRVGRILFDAGLLDVNAEYKPGIGDTKYQWFGGKRSKGKNKDVARYIAQNIE